MKKPILVVMAAGMGSRYGGLKQIDPVGSHGEAILDYSLYDAYRAGFETAVIIIKKAIEKDFMETVGKRLEQCPMEIRYAFQELDNIPEGFTVPEGRTKPWGTSHAVFCAMEQIDGAPFAVINADDYYGVSAYKVIFDHLSQNAQDYCMVGYELGKTVTDHGSVARGVCQVSDEGYLTDVVEDPTKNRAFLDRVAANRNFPVLLVINKIDLLKGNDDLERIIDRWKEILPQADVFPTSALAKFNVSSIMKRIVELLPDSPPFFGKDALTDKPARFFVTEIIRVKILLDYD